MTSPGQAVFEYEVDLVRSLHQSLPSVIPAKRGTVKLTRELAVGRAVADLVAICRTLKSPGIDSPLTTAECVILASLRIHGQTRIDILESRCGLERGDLRNGRLRRLEQNRFVQRGKGGMIQLARRPDAGCTIHAIEAKLTDWRAGLRQATAYRSFADACYLAMPGGGANNASRDDALRSSGIGLLTVWQNCVEIAIHAETATEHDWRREFAISRLVPGS